MERTLPERGWIGTSWFRSLGYYFGLRVDETPLGSRVLDLLAPFLVAEDEGEHRNPPTPGHPPLYSLADLGPGADLRHRLWLQKTLMFAADDPTRVLENLLWHVNTETILRTGEFVLVHSGAVTDPSGRAVLFPAASGGGKSTLVAGLVLSGFAYLSDEAAAIDPIEGDVYPYPKAIGLKDSVLAEHYPHLDIFDGVTGINGGYLTAGETGYRTAAGPASVAFVILPTYRRGAATRIEQIGSGEAALALGQNCASMRRYGMRCLPLLARIATEAACFRLVSGDLQEAVEAVRESVG